LFPEGVWHPWYDKYFQTLFEALMHVTRHISSALLIEPAEDCYQRSGQLIANSLIQIATVLFRDHSQEEDNAGGAEECSWQEWIFLNQRHLQVELLLRQLSRTGSVMVRLNCHDEDANKMHVCLSVIEQQIEWFEEIMRYLFNHSDHHQREEGCNQEACWCGIYAIQ
jgi:hypothetical protein